MGVIFDLDQTLIDSSIALLARSNREWNTVYGLIPNFKVYEGVHEVLSYLKENSISTAIVTSSPRPYYDKVIRHHKLSADYSVCYHDTSKRKPHPEPILKAVNYLDGKIVLSLGDDPKDIIASKVANVKSVACVWGTVNVSELIATSPDYVCNSIDELYELIVSLKDQL